MTDDRFTYEDRDGDVLHIIPDSAGIRLVMTSGDEDGQFAVDIPVTEVRKVTAAMHEQAGLPDRWAGLREHLAAAIKGLEGLPPVPGDNTTTVARGISAGAYRGVLARMDEIEASES